MDVPLPTVNTSDCKHVIEAKSSGSGFIGNPNVVALKSCKDFSERIAVGFGKGSRESHVPQSMQSLAWTPYACQHRC